jgi:hypothetical protein
MSPHQYAGDIVSPSQTEAIRAAILQIVRNWSDLLPDKSDDLYLADDRTVLFDVAPMQDVGWASQKARLRTVFSTFAEFHMAPNEDLTIQLAAYDQFECSHLPMVAAAQ